jgi:hypothetical protein
MPEFTPAQIAILDRLRARGFDLVAFPMYANYIGVRKGNCAVLLAPVESAALRLFGEPSYLVAGNLSVRLKRNGVLHFVWKQHSLEAGPEILAELQQFAAELSDGLAAIS